MRKPYQTEDTPQTTLELQIEIIKWEMGVLLETNRQLLLCGRRDQWESEKRIGHLRDRLDRITGVVDLELTQKLEAERRLETQDEPDYAIPDPGMEDKGEVAG